MDTQKIKAVLLAAKYKSLSKAAAEFSYTPSALSHSVDALEQELGIKLLHRSHTGVELTEAGELLLDKLVAVTNAEKELFQCSAAISASRQQTLRIGTYSSISSNLLPSLLNGFKELHPEISISILVGNHIGEWLDQDKADVLIGTEYTHHAWLPISNDDFVAVVPKTLFSRRRWIHWEELYFYSFIMTENLSIKQKIDLNRFKELIYLTSADDLSAVSMVREGMGVTILPSLALKECPRDVRILPLKPVLYRTIGVSYRKDSPAASGAAQFVQYLKNRETCT